MAGHSRAGAGRWSPARIAAAVVILALAAGGASSAPPAVPEHTRAPAAIAHADRARQCCSSPEATVTHRKCSDGSQLPLDCVLFRLNPAVEEDDAFELSADGKTLVYWNETTREFCVLKAADGSVEALVCFHEPGEQQDDPRPSWWFDVASALSWLSVACLALTLLAHVLLPDLRDLQGRCHMGAVASLALGLFMLAFLQAINMEEPLCTIMAFLAYYWLLSAFFWLNITSFNVWRSVVLEHIRFRERTLFAWYCGVSLGAPLILLLLLLTAHLLPEGQADQIRPGFGASKCWFRDDRATWLWFYWPLAVLLGLNVVYFVWTTARLWQQYGDSNTCRRKLLRRRCLLSLKLFLIMGISWIFELISSAADLPGHYAWYLTDSFNALQGVVILLVLVVVRRRVWRALHRLQPFGISPPERWAYPSHMRDCPDTATDTEDDEEAEDASRRHHELKDLSASNGSNGHATPAAPAATKAAS
ncbi:probable G-protein coupled receptor Mth-like 1 [Thrips palmi]|uniref:Probable G-protein coupled receptor Mth-like 1 n=1 Tax=Thrips palmi TaxID=161013 RepID=A0A6P8ZLB6_THRPL|nr:probable G-protein coupled receptor Mth-like 1 [Thrips palmi]